MTDGSVRPQPLVRAAVTAMAVGLLGQFLLGIYVNLYVPSTAIVEPGGSGGMMGGMGRMMSGGATLMVHMMLGWLLLLGAVLALVAAVVSKDRLAVALTGAGLVAIAVAGYGGLQFMATGHEGYSFAMAAGFAAAVASYAAQLSRR